VYIGGVCVLMSPVDFLQRPIRWLQAVSKYKATFSGGPNFAYDLCVKKITEEQKATLDLSHWVHAFSGAEPVRSGTLKQFAEAFAGCGFRYESFYPCYGLAEATLMVSGNDRMDEPVVLSVESAALELGRVQPVSDGLTGSRDLVGCGRVRDGFSVRIVDPATRTLCADDQVGEIWVAGPSVAHGYWNRPEETEAVFGARIAGSEEGPFLRTGDLGFVRDGQLFIAGRLKDLILIRGRNYHPQDLELTAESSHEAVTRAAAFSVEEDGEERLVLAAELDRRYRPRPGQTERTAALYKEVIGAIRRAIAQEHHLQASAILLVKAGSLPKTTSGKIQRHACRQQYLSKTLEIWGE
jgi:acyl-CoA synthetase (AMP-forming)/AMP-acid ligase II